MIPGPCKECPASGCGSYHSECEKYLEYKRRVKEDTDLRQSSTKSDLEISRYYQSKKKR